MPACTRIPLFTGMPACTRMRTCTRIPACIGISTYTDVPRASPAYCHGQVSSCTKPRPDTTIPSAGKDTDLVSVTTTGTCQGVVFRSQTNTHCSYRGEVSVCSRVQGRVHGSVHVGPLTCQAGRTLPPLPLR